MSVPSILSEVFSTQLVNRLAVQTWPDLLLWVPFFLRVNFFLLRVHLVKSYTILTAVPSPLLMNNEPSDDVLSSLLAPCASRDCMCSTCSGHEVCCPSLLLLLYVAQYWIKLRLELYGLGLYNIHLFIYYTYLDKMEWKSIRTQLAI